MKSHQPFPGSTDSFLLGSDYFSNLRQLNAVWPVDPRAPIVTDRSKAIKEQQDIWRCASADAGREPFIMPAMEANLSPQLEKVQRKLKKKLTKAAREHFDGVTGLTDDEVNAMFERDPEGSKMHNFARRLSETEAQLFLDEPKKMSKKMRITMLETDVRILQNQVKEMAKRFEDYVATHMPMTGEVRMQQFDGTVKDQEGIPRYGKYEYQIVICWTSGGNWFYNYPGGVTMPTRVSEPKLLKWYKIIS